jgi:Fibronectin type III domain
MAPIPFRLALGAAVAVGLSVLGSMPAWSIPPPERPPPPTDVSVMPGNAQATVTWDGQWDQFGYLPDGYVARTSGSTPGPSCSAMGMSATTCTITGLTNGVQYRVRVYATYKVRTGGKERKGKHSTPVTFTPESS